MKLAINKKFFLTSWNLAERSSGSSSSGNNILSSVFIHADSSGVTLKATDVKNSIICSAKGVTVIEDGEAVFPVKIVSDLFKKIPSEEFLVDVSDGRVLLKAGKSKYNFSSYPVREFPDIETSEHKKAPEFCKLSAAELSKLLEEGTIAALTSEEFPLYISSADFQIKDGTLYVVSTDTRRLALSSVPVAEASEESEALLPMKGVKELQRIISSMEPETEVTIFFDDAQFYFKTKDVEFTVRRVESKFPNFKKIIPSSFSLTMTLDRALFISALERISIIVRDFTNMALFDIVPDKAFMVQGRAPDFGQAKEEFEAKAEGEPLRIALNVKYLIESLKVIREPNVKLGFNGKNGHVSVKRSDGDDFMCLIAPMNIPEEELEFFEKVSE